MEQNSQEEIKVEEQAYACGLSAVGVRFLLEGAKVFSDHRGYGYPGNVLKTALTCAL